MKYILILITIIYSSFSFSENIFYLSLKDKLDRPIDGYCLDVAGNGQYVRLDVPLNAHNCKLESEYIYPDHSLVFKDNGTIYFPSFDKCLTVIGLNNHALEYNSLMLKECLVVEPFLNAKRFQLFKFNEKNQIQLYNSDLCIVAGDESKETYSSEHTWRSLYMQKCKTAQYKLSTWYLKKMK